MKYLLLALALATAGAARAAPPAEKGASPPLRSTLRQYHPDATQLPRRLSAGERAELRRQLAEAARRAQRRSPFPTWKNE
jgi:hypothetical protein